MAVSRPRDEDQQLLTLDQLRGFARLTRRLARPHGHLRRRLEEAESLTPAAFPAYAATDHMAASSLPTAVELTSTRNYIHTDASSANPAKGNLHERRIWPKP